MQAISQGVTDPQFLVHNGLSFQHQGRMDKAFTVFRDAATLHAHMGVMQFYLYACFFMPNGFELYAREARAWAARFGRFAAPPMPRAPLDGRRLRLGYVAPGIIKTQLRQFLTPVLDAHDSESVEVILYVHNPADEEGATCDRMVATGGLSDDQLTELIRNDQVDVLIDTWGHTAGSRMGVFARRAAPVQIAWINFVQTTGLTTMDYVLHSDSMAAPGTDALFTETVFSMGPVTIPYRPALSPSEPAATPALDNGIVTFASFNHPAKFSAETVRAWARILKGCENSVLLLKYSYFTDPVVQRTFRARFEAHGVDPERVIFEGFSLGAEYARSFTRIDLALDPSPCPGGTTTCDALANGVPVLTLAGGNFYARIGLQAIDFLGVPELVASSWDDYVEKAVGLGNDIARLNEIRGGIRAAFEASPIRDEKGFTRRFEAVLRDMAGRADAVKVA
jgi:predicted O-linked N-acetylglucosamine transferase (SPINDLY family)